MQLFVLTNHCKAKVHCKTCRNREGGRPWRTSLKKMFQLPDDNVDFECPWGEQWNSDGGAAVALSLPENSPVTETPAPETPPAPEPTPQLPPHSREALQAAARARQAGATRSTGTGGCGCGRK